MPLVLEFKLTSLTILFSASLNQASFIEKQRPTHRVLQLSHCADPALESLVICEPSVVLCLRRHDLAFPSTNLIVVRYGEVKGVTLHVKTGRSFRGSRCSSRHQKGVNSKSSVIRRGSRYLTLDS